MAKEQTIVIDFDSTLIQVEALDELAKIALKGHPGAADIVSRIEAITKDGMEGKISISDSLRQRLELLSADRNHIVTLVKLLKSKITQSFKRNRDFLEKNRERIFIVTNGFREYVVPVIEELGLKKENVLANTFTFDKRGRVSGFDQRNPLAQDRGKVAVVSGLKRKGEILVIGDGYTDYQTKESGVVSQFYAFTENIERELVVKSADRTIRSFDEFLYHQKLPMALSYPKSKIKCLLLENVHPEAVNILKGEGFSVESVKEALSEQELIARIKDVSLLGIRSKTRVSAKVLNKAKRLMGIGAFCIGTDQTDLDQASDQGVVVFNAPYSNTRSVVELVLGEMIVLMRRTFELSQELHHGRWIKSAAGSYEVRGKKLGIVGYGNTGGQLSVLAEGLGMEVYYYDIIERMSLGNARRVRTLNELLNVADVLTLHVDGRASNKHLISVDEFRAMKEGVVFLNLSRGHVVDLDALSQALETGKVRGAALDVFPKEPASIKEPFKSKLCGLPNVILTPHVGGSTAEAQRAIAEYVCGRLLDYVNNGGSFGSVNFPNIQLPKLERAHRVLHIHRNVPGILARINGILAKSRSNILGQYLKTTERIGYVITDVDKEYDRKVIEELRKIPDTIKFRVLY